MWSAARLRASPGPQWGWRRLETPAREAPHIQADSATASADLPPYVPMRRYAAILAALALIAVLVVGLRQAGGDSTPKRKFDLAQAERKLTGAPAPLASLHQQSSQLLPGGRKAFRARLASLKGYPVVVNKWASWCVPCRTRVPDLPAAGREAGQAGRVPRRQRGRLDRPRPPLPGVRAAALPLLPRPRRGHREDDPAPANYPITVFFDRRGKLAYIHQGGYRNAVRPRRRHAALPRPDARSAGPATSRSSPPRSRCAIEVFCGEQGVTLDGDRDGRDDEAVHLVAVDDGEVLGTCRMLIEPGGTARFGRLCVRRAPAAAGSPPRCSPRPSARRARPARSASACTRRPARCRSTSAPATRPTATRFDEEGIEHLGWRSTLHERAPRRPAHRPEVDHRRRPRLAARRRLPRRAAPTRSTPRRTRSSRATRTARRPRCGRCAPAAGSRTRPAGSCARPEPLPRGQRRRPRARRRTPTPTSSPPRPPPARRR